MCWCHLCVLISVVFADAQLGNAPSYRGGNHGGCCALCPMHLVSKLLPAMLLSIALIALSPMSPPSPRAKRSVAAGPSCRRLMLVYTLMDLARNSIAVTHPGSATTARKSEYNVQLQALISSPNPVLELMAMMQPICGQGDGKGRAG